jgi:hypothetical protein
MDNLDRHRSPAGNLPLRMQRVPEQLRYEGMPMTDREVEIFHAGGAVMKTMAVSAVQGLPPEVPRAWGRMMMAAVALSQELDGEGNSVVAKRLNPFLVDCMERVEAVARYAQANQPKVAKATPGQVASLTGHRRKKILR